MKSAEQSRTFLSDTQANALSYDTPNSEILLIDQAPVLGRRTELRQLLKLIHLSKQGQGKAILISGDAGIGKSALINAFVNIVEQSIYSRILDCRKVVLKTPQQLYVLMIDRIREDAEHLLEEALIAINQEMVMLDMRWERQDLIRAVSLVQMQDVVQDSKSSTTSPVGVSAQHEQLAKALRNSVPTVKKLKLSVNDSIDKLVKLILNPWVMTAASIVKPIHTSLSSAFDLADRIKSEGWLLDDSLTGLDASSGKTLFFRETTQIGNLEETVYEDDYPAIAAQSVVDVSETASMVLPAIKYNTVTPPPAAKAGQLPLPKGPVGIMVSHLSNVLHHINQSIENIDSSLLIVLDQWEQLASLPTRQRQEIKQLLCEVLARTTEQPNVRLMTILGCDTRGGSLTLGGPLYHQFRTKLLLPELDENHARKLFKQVMKASNIEFEEAVHQRLYLLSGGNPYWHLKLARYLSERAQSNRTDTINLAFYDKLGIENTADLLELAFTRLKLAFIHQEDILYKVIAVLIKSYDLKPFKLSELIQEVSVSQGISDNVVYDILQHLIRHDFIVAEKTPEQRRVTHHRVQSPFEYRFLAGKTQTIQTDISTDEKLHYLRKIIPLSVQAGELDREKTQEVLALCHTLGNTEMVDFLETVFLENIHHEKPTVRVTALNNLALIDSQSARQALFKALKDEEAMVREYAARNLSIISQKTVDPEFHRRVVESLLDILDDEYEAVRSQVYQTLSKYRWNHDLTAVFIKGMADACEEVRLISVKNLSETETDSPFVKSSLMDALDDASPEIRKYACIGIQHFTGSDVIQVLVERMRHDEDPSIRALAADSLSRMQEKKAFASLKEALQDPLETEDVKLAVVRTLSKCRGWQSEEVLLEALQQSDNTPPALLWACIRSLGLVGGTERSIHTLVDLIQHCENDIIRNAASIALKKIKSRIDDLRQLERQLEEATPVATVVENEPDVTILEDEPLDSPYRRF